MKKCLLFILILTLFVPQAYASNANSITVSTPFKTTIINNGVYNIDGTTYLPLLEVSEALGAVVFENTGEYEGYYIITRSGDIITHYAWTLYYEFNGEIKYIPTISIKDGTHGILVPQSMIENIFGITLFCGSNGITINAQMVSNYYTEVISKILIRSISSNFYAENFIRYFTYSCNYPWLDIETVITNVNIGLDKKYFEDAKIISDASKTSLLVNKLNFLPENFAAENLTAVYSLYVKSPGRKHYLNAEAYNKYVEMYDAAAKEGVYLKIVSSYRTEDYQRNLYNSYLRNNGFAYAEKYSARPGYSEHQTGLAVDINSLYTSFELSNEYRWLKAHAHEYGFIERYQKGKEHITGYAYEPWHYRYVGTDAAKTIYEQNITYEEFYAKYVYKSPYKLNDVRTKSNVLEYFHK